MVCLAFILALWCVLCCQSQFLMLLRLHNASLSYILILYMYYKVRILHIFQSIITIQLAETLISYATVSLLYSWTLWSLYYNGCFMGFHTGNSVVFFVVSLVVTSFFWDWCVPWAWVGRVAKSVRIPWNNNFTK